MIGTIYKQFVFFLCCLYTVVIFVNQKPTLSKTFYKYFIYAAFLCLETTLLKSFLPEFSVPISALTLLLLSLLIFHTSYNMTISFSLISYGINLLIYEVISFLIVIIVAPFYSNIDSQSLEILNIIVTSICPLFLYLLTNNKHFKNSYRILFSKNVRHFACFVSILALVLICIENSTSYYPSHRRLLRIAMILAAAFFLVLWWRSQITKSYREQLRILEIESLRAAQTEQTAYINQLKSENERMGRIIHKDNRIVNAMADSVAFYLHDAPRLSNTEIQRKGNALLSQLTEIRTDRQQLLQTPSVLPQSIPQTSHVGVDALIAYMIKEAAQYKITLSFHFRKDFFDNNLPVPSDTDLVHLLSDALENAIIATRISGGSSIELSMMKIKEIPTISIADSGIPFEVKTYMNLGLQKSSTHLDTGGSGIGLLDLWSLKENYRATLYIDEYPDIPNMSKRVVFLFDQKNRYIISTKRFKELQQQQTRADIFIVNPNTEAVL